MMSLRLPVMQRTCGACSVCCDYVSIAELNKPARVLCRNVGESGHSPDGRCTIHGAPERPTVCRSFLCSWMRGHGSDEDRPDKSGVMVSINALPGEESHFALVLELAPGAVVGRGAAMVAVVAAYTRLPAIVSNFESLPPNDRGDRVAVHTSILYRSRRMVGALLGWLGPEVALHELVKGR